MDFTKQPIGIRVVINSQQKTNDQNSEKLDVMHHDEKEVFDEQSETNKFLGRLGRLPKKMVHASAEMSSHVNSLRCFIVILSIALIMSIYSNSQAPSKLRLLYPPMVGNGAIVSPSDRPKGPVLAYTSYLWEEVNTWMKSGKTEAYTKLVQYHNYLGEYFIQQLSDAYKSSETRGELDRQRRITQVPGAMSDLDSRVITVVPNKSWIVYLDTIVEEWYLGTRVVHEKRRYFLNVEAVEMTDENPIGIKIVGFAKPQKTLEVYGQ